MRDGSWGSPWVAVLLGIQALWWGVAACRAELSPKCGSVTLLGDVEGRI